jgi:hypothetical protein
MTRLFQLACCPRQGVKVVLCLCRLQSLLSTRRRPQQHTRQYDAMLTCSCNSPHPNRDTQRVSTTHTQAGWLTIFQHSATAECEQLS